MDAGRRFTSTASTMRLVLNSARPLNLLASGIACGEGF